MKTTKFATGAFLLVLASVPAVSQTFRGSIAGTVVDPTDAVAANVAVQASNAETGLKRETVSSAAGEFSFPDLPPGRYSILASLAGFDRVKTEGVAVEVGKVTTLKITLRVASQSQTVEV